MGKRSMDYDVYCGVDVGKSSLHAVALDEATGARILDREIVYEEGPIREALGLLAGRGEVLVVVDQCGGFGRMAVAVAKASGFDVAHISPRRFHDVAGLYGEDKTDGIDAFIIAETAMCQPRFVDPVPDTDALVAESRALLACREAVSKERTAGINRMHALLQQACPPMAALFSGGGWTLGDPLPLQVMAKYGGSFGLRRAGRARALRWAARIRHYPAAGPALVGDMLDAVGRQGVRADDEEAIGRIIRKTAERVRWATEDKKELDALISAKLTSANKLEAIMSVPGIGQHFGAVIVCEVGDIGRFPDEAHLASYSGVAPASRESGKKKGGKKRKGGNRELKNAFVRSARLAVQHGDPASVAYFDKKRAEGKTKNAAYLALARRRVPLIYSILSSGPEY